jgi:photosystem II stability/assembly factor-like uncharacterized protein
MTVDGGRSWVRLLDDPSLVPIGVAALSATTAWVVGYQAGLAPNTGLIVKTEDGDATWTTQLRRDHGPLTDPSIVSPSVVWVAGNDGALLVTENGGLNWVERSAPGQRRDGFFDARYDVVGLPGGRAWLVNSAEGVYATADLGRTWTRAAHVRQLYHLAAESDASAIAVGDTTRIMVARPAGP